jgi:hypothetical protein
VVKSRYYSGIFLERLRNTTKSPVSIADISVEIRTKNLLYTSLELYC